MKNTANLLVILLILLCFQARLSAEPARLTEKSHVVFASLEKGRAALLTPDRYTKVLSRFDLESRLKTNNAVTADDLMNYAAEQVLPWSEGDQSKMKAIIERVALRFTDYELPFPAEVLLIQTTGKEEGDAAYCRRHAVIFPRRYIQFPESQLETIFIHELFHVLSSHNPKLQQALYEVIGFKPCPDIKLPALLADNKITNPDGPSLNHYIELNIGDKQQLAVPLLYSSERFDPEKNKSFFDYLNFRLLVTERDGDQWFAAEESGAPILLDPKSIPSFHKQIGRNTKYILHPDEVLADNFVHLIKQKQGLPNPEIVGQMAKLLDGNATN